MAMVLTKELVAWLSMREPGYGFLRAFLASLLKVQEAESDLRRLRLGSSKRTQAMIIA